MSCTFWFCTYYILDYFFFQLSNKLITDKPLEVFGPWQVQDYEPPVAENGIVPRNAYGNVELFKQCMLPKGTVHIKCKYLSEYYILNANLNHICFVFKDSFTNRKLHYQLVTFCREHRHTWFDYWYSIIKLHIVIKLFIF